jgi:16S rRNA G966 N2-methylase RsmD
MALVAAAARGGARSVAKKAVRSLSSGADVFAGSGYVAIDAKRRERDETTIK